VKEKDTVLKIIDYVGGKDNIKKAWHCMTRLRFDLYDQSLIEHDKVKQLQGVIGEQLQRINIKSSLVRMSKSIILF
jgi:beta-glucoside PTS system EIICBA component